MCILGDMKLNAFSCRWDASLPTIIGCTGCIFPQSTLLIFFFKKRKKKKSVSVLENTRKLNSLC